MTNVNGYPEVCTDCGKRRTCNDAGMCHECAQAAREDSVIIIDGEEYTPGGFAL